MLLSVIVCLLSCAGLIVCVLAKPAVTVKGVKISVYWLPAFAGGILLLITGTLSAQETWRGLTASGSMNPLKILALFISLTLISVYLDELGFFRRLAGFALRRAAGSQKKLFLLLYATVSVLTVFTSNDVVVLTFTPFICCFCKEEKISPIPYLVAEFVAANTWSMALVIGNPTNIYLASAANVGFAEYLSVMWLPALFAGCAGLAVLWLIFRKTLSAPVSPVSAPVPVADRFLLIIGLTHLIVCVVCLALSSYIGLPMWAVATVAAGSLGLCTAAYSFLRRRLSEGCGLLGRTFRRAPWELIPFVLSMFVVVLSLEKYGVTERLASLFDGVTELVSYGAASYFIANIINNIPMSVLFGGVLSVPGSTLAGVYATVIGSNLGACFTPLGALAGIMWTGLLKNYGVRLSFLRFVAYGAAVSLPSLAAALFALAVVL